MENNWTCIYTSNQLHLVEIVKAVLNDNAIEARVIDKRDSSYISIGDIEVYVPTDLSVLARMIIQEHQL